MMPGGIPVVNLNVLAEVTFPPGVVMTIFTDPAAWTGVTAVIRDADTTV
jgi:hypothetical protein